MAVTAAMRTQVTQLYVALFGRAPDSEGLGYWVNEISTGAKTLVQVAQAMYDTTPARTYYPLYLTNNEIVTNFYTNVLGRTPDADGLAYWSGQLATKSAGQVIADMITAVVNYAGTDAAALTSQTLFNNKEAVAEYYAVTQQGSATNATAAISGVTATSDVSTDAAKAAIITAGTATVSAQTFTLTTGVDQGTAFTGGAGNDTFNASATATFNALDSLNGGAGTDTLNVLDNAAAVATANRTVTNIEVANLSSSGTVTADTTGWTGLTTLTAVGSGGVNVTAASTTTITASNTGANAMAIIGGGGASTFATGAAAVTIGQTAVANAFTSVAVTGGSTIAITDKGTATTTGSTLKTVSVTGNAASDDVTVTANGLTALNLTTMMGATTVGDVTVTAAAATRALTVTLNGMDTAADGAATGAATATITDATATSLAINAVTAKSYDITAVAGAATAVTVNADVALQMDALTAGVATTVGISGAAGVTITADTLAAAAVITSTNTGGVTLTQNLTANQQFVGTASSGADAIGVAIAGTKAITTGAGNDTVTYSGALGSGGSIDAGDGTDTLLTTAALAVTATGSATFAGTVSNFEVLKFSATTGAARAINMANADGINSLISAGVDTGALTITGAAANFTYTQTAASNQADSIALASDVGTSDNVNLAFSAADGFTNTGALTVANVETLTITTDDTDTTATTAVFVAPITATSVKTVTVTGDAGIDLTGLTATTITSLDASGLTGTGAVEGLAWTAGALAASSTIKGSATGDNTVTFSAANTASTFVTYTGGSGADTVTGSNGLNNVVDLGNGTNSYTQAGAGNATVTGGTGADTISVGTGSNTVHLGGGTTANQVTVGAAAGLNVIDTTSTGVDTIVLGGVQTAAGYYTSVTGLAAGDKIDFSGVTTVARADGALGAKITLGGASTFANYLDAATATTIADAGASLMSWFQFGGNTYIVVDNTLAALTPDDTNTFQDGVDSVIELVGLYTLTTAATATDVLTLV